MLPVDLHILHTEQHLHQFKALIEYNLNLLQHENINVKFYECASGDIARCRADAATSGTAPYFAWIDCDDVLIQGAYQKLSDAIDESGKPFAWMNETVVLLDENQREISIHVDKRPHHIHIIHKDIVDFDYLRDGIDKKRPDSWTIAKMADGVHVNEIGYIWRRRKNGLSITSFS